MLGERLRLVLQGGARLRHHQLLRHDARVEGRQAWQDGRVGVAEAQDHGVVALQSTPAIEASRNWNSPPVALLAARSSDHFTSSTVSGEPSANFRFGRSLKVIALPSSTDRPRMMRGPE